MLVLVLLLVLVLTPPLAPAPLYLLKKKYLEKHVFGKHVVGLGKSCLETNWGGMFGERCLEKKKVFPETNCCREECVGDFFLGKWKNRWET